MSSCKSCDGVSTTTNCPTRMADGRAFTDYRPRCVVNAELMQALNKSKSIQSSFESRMYLQHNAETWIDQERDRAMKNLVPCAPCKRPFSDPGTMLLERYVVKCDSVTCSRTEVNPNGLGDGRAY